MKESENLRAKSRAFVILLAALALHCAQQRKEPSSPLLLGGLSPDSLFQRLPRWKQVYESYSPDSSAVKLLRGLQEPVEVLVFLGTWCEDSEREVPRLAKTLDVVGNSHIAARYLGVPRSFRETDDAAAQYEIVAVPTFIVRKGAVEIGRIVETPKTRIENDLVAILLHADLIREEE
ncbi:MAG: thioredoxin family protein [candidate division KSB1 bacterium]|nr:thioredoxin family protein [candidate division KSB1 bacterium]